MAAQLQCNWFYCVRLRKLIRYQLFFVGACAASVFSASALPNHPVALTEFIALSSCVYMTVRNLIDSEYARRELAGPHDRAVDDAAGLDLSR